MADIHVGNIGSKNIRVPSYLLALLGACLSAAGQPKVFGKLIIDRAKILQDYIEQQDEDR